MEGDDVRERRKREQKKRGEKEYIILNVRGFRLEGDDDDDEDKCFTKTRYVK